MLLALCCHFWAELLIIAVTFNSYGKLQNLVNFAAPNLYTTFQTDKHSKPNKAAKHNLLIAALPLQHEQTGNILCGWCCRSTMPNKHRASNPAQLFVLLLFTELIISSPMACRRDIFPSQRVL